MSERFVVEGFGGALLHPGDAGYDEARQVFNGMIDRRPAVIARCSSADDVVRAVNLARERGLTISVYGGGHGLTGSAVCDDGVCVDLRGMKGIDVDPSAQTVRAEGGVNWGEFDAATLAHGLAVTGGRNATTGVAGLTLGSGSGWIERKYGFVCDNLIKVDMVTADGRKVVASDTENPELFWGLRGGGGNFGIVTAFYIRLHKIGPVLTGPLLYPPQMAAAVLRNYRDFMADAPDEVGGGVVFTTAPDAPFVPPPARGKPVVMVNIVYVGDPAEGEKVLAPLRAFGPPVADLVHPSSYAEVQGGPPNPWGNQQYSTADFMTGLPDEAIDTLAVHALTPISPETAIIVIPGGGAPSRVGEEATAFGARNAPFNIHYLAAWTDPADNTENIRKIKAIAASMKPWATGRVYLNFLSDDSEDRINESFGEKKLRRLRALKAVWDPENLFRHNQNIKPLRAAAE
ncbi:MAG TPA: FAD-binding oxidoreductase [Devosia sp.]|nr:FAD-binding oxidoreductase [Devosia sp.]